MITITIKITIMICQRRRAALPGSPEIPPAPLTSDTICPTPRAIMAPYKERGDA
jgi:hypothetical protein